MRLSTYKGTEPYIFISYAHKDSETVLPIVAALQQNGFRIWFDQGIEAGTEWPEYIAEHLEKAGAVIVFMSNAAADSQNCRREVSFAVSNGKEPVVVYLEDTELPKKLDFYLHNLHALMAKNYKTLGGLVKELCRSRALQTCRDETCVSEIDTEWLDELISQPITVDGQPAEPQAETEDKPDDEVDEPQEKRVEEIDDEVEEKPDEEPAHRPRLIEELSQSPSESIVETLNPNKNEKRSLKSTVPTWIAWVLVVLVAVIAIGLAWYYTRPSDQPKEVHVYKKTYLQEIEVSEDWSTKYIWDVFYRKDNKIVTKIDFTFWVDVSRDEKLAADEQYRNETLRKVEQQADIPEKLQPFTTAEATYKDNRIYLCYHYGELDKNENAKLFCEEEFSYIDIGVNSADGDYRIDYNKLDDWFPDLGRVPQN